ncbi:MAG: Aspartate aminotransferase [Phycisphaerae bacterium]|nr:Aspartate aminotransferase [Phycisphaerae bacterium]
MSIEQFLSRRAVGVKESGIRRIFNLAATLTDPIDFSIGQPDYDVPLPIKQAAIQAIQSGRNGYTLSQGLPELRAKILNRLEKFYPAPPGVLVTCGVSGGLVLALLATLNPGDEVLFADPYFVSYLNLVSWFDGISKPIITYPDFRLTAERVEPFLTPKSKILLLNSPNNPTGVVYPEEDIRRLCRLAEKHNLLIISDEIYCDLSYDHPSTSPIEFAPQRTLLLRGFGKSYGMTGWRMGYAAGPAPLINTLTNLQQYIFVCAPQPAQHAVVTAMETDISPQVEQYRQKRNIVVQELAGAYEFARPSGGFYFFIKVPQKYESATRFVEAAIEKKVLCVPGSAFSQQDTHFRISYALPDDRLREGCKRLRSLA